MIVMGCVLLLIRLLGWVGLISIAILSLFIPLESYIADQSRGNKKLVSKQSDQRMSLIYELIDGIKTLKLTGLKEFVLSRVSERRNQELNLAWKGRVLDASNLVIARIVPVLVISLTFAMYLFHPFFANSAEVKLDAAKVFATLSLINIMGRPISVIPKSISLLSGCLVSLKRIEDLIRLSEEYMSCEDNQIGSPGKNSISTSPSSEITVEFSNVTVLREQISKATVEKSQNSTPEKSFSTPLQNINFSIRGPGLVLIVGDNGSGKTTLLQVILNELQLQSTGGITVVSKCQEKHLYNPRIAYCGHEAWIMRDTLRRNILMGDPDYNENQSVDESRYQQVLRACCLEHDILNWPQGDLTVMGEKGVTISGGQKARVSLARALYSRAPILLLDCPLAGLDQQVRNHVFLNAIQEASKSSLVIMVTHQLDLLPKCDQLLVLQKGMLVYQGSYNQMTNSSICRDILSQIASQVEVAREKSLDSTGLKSTQGNQYSAIY